MRAYPPPFVMCERVRVVSECRSLGVLLLADGFGLPSSGVLVSAAALGGFWLARVSAVSFRRRSCRSSALFGLVSCFFVAVGSFFGSCQKVACGFNFGVVSVRHRVGVSPCRSGGGNLTLFLRVCVGAHLPQPSCVAFLCAHSVHEVF